MPSNQNQVSPTLSDKRIIREGEDNPIKSRNSIVNQSETKEKVLQNMLLSLSGKLDELVKVNERFFQMIESDEKEESYADNTDREDSLYQISPTETYSTSRLVYQLSSLMGLLKKTLNFSDWGVFLLRKDISDPADPDGDMEEVASSYHSETDELSKCFENEVKAQCACGHITQAITHKKRMVFPTERGNLLIVPLEPSSGKDGFWAMQFEKGILASPDSNEELVLWGADMVITCVENSRLNKTLIPPPERKAYRLEEEKFFTLSELSKAMIHEINNSLQIIQGRAQIARMNQNKPQANDVNSGIWETIENNANRICTILKNFSDFLHRQSGRIKTPFPQNPERNIEVSTREVNLQHILESNLVLLQYILGSSGIELELKNGGDLPSVCGEPKELELALLSLMWGIRDNLPSGGHILIHTSSDKEFLYLNVVWAGKGSDRERMISESEISDNARFKLASQILKKPDRDLRFEKMSGGERKITLNIPIARNKT